MLMQVRTTACSSSSTPFDKARCTALPASVQHYCAPLGLTPGAAPKGGNCGRAPAARRPRADAPAPPAPRPVGLGLCLSGVGGWLGGEFSSDSGRKQAKGGVGGQQRLCCTAHSKQQVHNAHAPRDVLPPSCPTAGSHPPTHALPTSLLLLSKLPTLNLQPCAPHSPSPCPCPTHLLHEVVKLALRLAHAQAEAGEVGGRRVLRLLGALEVGGQEPHLQPGRAVGRWAQAGGQPAGGREQVGTGTIQLFLAHRKWAGTAGGG